MQSETSNKERDSMRDSYSNRKKSISHHASRSNEPGNNSQLLLRNQDDSLHKGISEISFRDLETPGTTDCFNWYLHNEEIEEALRESGFDLVRYYKNGTVHEEDRRDQIAKLAVDFNRIIHGRLKEGKRLVRSANEKQALLHPLNERLKIENDSLKKEGHVLQNELYSVRIENVNLVKKLNEISLQIGETSAQLREQRLENEKLKAEIELLVDQCQEERIRNQNMGKNQLKELNDALEAMRKDRREEKSEIDSIQKRINQFQEEFWNFKEGKQSVSFLNGKIGEKTIKMEGKLPKKEENLQEILLKVKSLVESSNKMKNAVELKKEDFGNLVMGSLTCQKALFIKEIKALRKELKEHQESARNSENFNAFEDLLAQIREKDTQIEELSSQMDFLNEKQAGLEEETRKLIEESERLRAKNKKKKKRIEELLKVYSEFI